jgi:hypothetical protein
LLAHELGHILLETQTKENTADSYKDHYCPGLNDYCPQTHLMSSGGADERIYYKAPALKKIIGYTELPQVDLVQCEALKNHPLVKKE